MPISARVFPPPPHSPSHSSSSADSKLGPMLRLTAALCAALLAVACQNASAFAPASRSSKAAVQSVRSAPAASSSSSKATSRSVRSAATELNMLAPTDFEAAASLTSSTSNLIADGGAGEIAKAIGIPLLFGGGLIPAAIIANKSMVNTLMKKRPEKPNLTEEEKKTYLDPTFGVADYVEDSGATGKNLPGSALLFAPERIPLSDVVAIVGRLSDVDSVANWRDLPSTKLPNVSETKPPMWLPRATFKANVRKAKFQGWPADDKGRPIGGEELKAAEEARISKQGALIGDAALDAVFDTWAWGANIATPDKVSKELTSWRPDTGSFNQLGFTLSAISGRALVGIAALSFVVIQVVAYGTLFIAPALRVFAGIDIGFGEMGGCDPEMCTKLFN